MDEARIPWRDHEAYDDWDDICSSLYANMVVRSIQHASVCDESSLDLPAYGSARDDYSELSYIAVQPAEASDALQRVFIAFATASEPFDSVRCGRSDEGHRICGALETIPAEVARFSLMLREAGGRYRRVDRLVITL
jgi:hypothetical protein